MKKHVSFPRQGDTKEKNSKNRISFHSQTQNFNNFDANYNISNTKELLARQRSFVRPNSVNYLGNDFDEGVELQRQRSFVIPGQYQVRHHNKKRGGAVAHRGKPTMELYRPPTMRNSNENGYAEYDGSKPGLNIHAKEFVSLEHSRSSNHFHNHKHSNKLQHSKSGHNLRANLDTRVGNTSPPRVHFSDDKENEPDKNPGSGRSGFGGPIKRSKSLGSADFRNPYTTERSPLADLGPFSQDVYGIISKALNDPNTLSARQLMDVVKHVCQRVVESSRYAEPTARLSIMIIEKEDGETFLESLLNTCQEFFQEKDRLLRNSPPGPYPGYVASHPKWIAFMSFLNEMYTQLKRRHVQLMTQKNAE